MQRGRGYRGRYETLAPAVESTGGQIDVPIHTTKQKHVVNSYCCILLYDLVSKGESVQPQRPQHTGTHTYIYTSAIAKHKNKIQM